MGKKAVHFGAGNIGRGFVAEFLHQSGYEVVFVDVMDKIIDQLNEKKSYKVIQVGAEGDEESVVTNYRAINSKTHKADVITEISSADLLTCSVGPHTLEFIAPLIAEGIAARSNDQTPLAVIACENAIGATDTLARHIKEVTPLGPLISQYQRTRFANSAIDRIVPAQEEDAGLNITLERFHEWVVDRTPFNGHEPPYIKGVKWVDDLLPYIERKLFTVNTGHAAAAYYGYNLNKTTVYGALQDQRVLEEVKKALSETSELIISKHGINAEDQKEYVDKIIKRISNPHLEDAVERVGRAPLRKLSRKERFIGPAAELAAEGKDCTGLLYAAEMAFRFQDVGDDEESAELAKIMKEKSPYHVVQQVCELEPDHPLFDMMVKVVRKVQSEKVNL